MKLTKTCARFLRKHGGTLLVIGASVGVVLTAIETGKATIKAEKLVELNKDVPEYGMKEKVKDCWQFYIPAAVLGAGTIGCIIGSNMLSRKEIASLSAAYVALGKSYQEYRRQVAERIGVEEEEKLRMEAAKETKAEDGYVPGDNEKEGGEWTATGTQFQVPYVFKTLFSHEDIVFNDLCETKSVSKGAIYLDKNEDLAEGEHNYIFVGRVGQFCPIKPGCGGALLVREAGVKDNGEAKYDSVTGAKDYRWLESEMVYNLHLEETIDRSYFDKMATKAVEAISEYGDFEQFASNDLGEPPWQKPDIPWDDVQDEAAQNFDVR